MIVCTTMSYYSIKHSLTVYTPVVDALLKDLIVANTLKDT